VFLSKTDQVPVPNAQVVGSGPATGPVVFSKPSTAIWEKPLIEMNKNNSCKVNFFMK
jgi:hypothetical protein